MQNHLMTRYPLPGGFDSSTWPLPCWSLRPFAIPRISSSNSQVQLNYLQALIHCCCSNLSCWCSGWCCCCCYYCSLIGSVVAITPGLFLRRRFHPAAVAYSYALPWPGVARVRYWRGSLLENRCTCWRDINRKRISGSSIKLLYYWKSAVENPTERNGKYGGMGETGRGQIPLGFPKQASWLGNYHAIY